MLIFKNLYDAIIWFIKVFIEIVIDVDDNSDYQKRNTKYDLIYKNI